MDFLGVVGNSSNLPYQTNTVNYYMVMKLLYIMVEV
jgi:hypothetical protein